LVEILEELIVNKSDVPGPGGPGGTVVKQLTVTGVTDDHVLDGDRAGSGGNMKKRVFAAGPGHAPHALDVDACGDIWTFINVFINENGRAVTNHQPVIEGARQGIVIGTRVAAAGCSGIGD
jgi:hypothetical protein